MGAKQVKFTLLSVSWSEVLAEHQCYMIPWQNDCVFQRWHTNGRPGVVSCFGLRMSKHIQFKNSLTVTSFSFTQTQVILYKTWNKLCKSCTLRKVKWDIIVTLRHVINSFPSCCEILKNYKIIWILMRKYGKKYRFMHFFSIQLKGIRWKSN